MLNQRTVIITLLMLLATAAASFAQNLTAQQMSIYYGHPKSVVITSPQGSNTTEFDRQGRITAVTQGNMRMVYDWADDNSSITVSMYQGQNVVDSNTVELAVFTPREYKYSFGGVTMDVTFRENGSFDKAVMSDGQQSMTMTYFYRNAADMYPYAIEQAQGEQSIKVTMNVEEVDGMGNPTVFSGEMMGNRMETRQSIEYYE